MGTQHKLAEKRPPRVNITYDFEVGEAREKKELPFVIGVIGEFSRTDNSTKEHEFTTITKENFSNVMQGLNPSVSIHVENRVTDEGGLLPVNLTFHEMENFAPESIARNVEPLRKLLEARSKLSDLKVRTLSNEKLREHLMSITLGLADVTGSDATPDTRQAEEEKREE